MAVVHGYCSVEQVRAELGDDGEALPEALLEKAVNAASRAVDDWTGRRFWADETAVTRRYPRAEVVDGSVMVDDISTVADLAVTVDGRTWTLDDDFELAPANADADGGAYAWWELAELGAAFPARPRVTVTAKFGWAAVPVQVEEATILRAVALFKRKDAAYGVADFGEFGPVRITRKDPDVMDLLRPFQKAMAG